MGRCLGADRQLNIIAAQFTNSRQKVLVVGAYAPTNISKDSVKDDFYDKLHDVLKRAADDQKVILVGDFNADINPQERNSARRGCCGPLWMLEETDQ